jgi:hypothetical protein
MSDQRKTLGVAALLLDSVQGRSCRLFPIVSFLVITGVLELSGSAQSVSSPIRFEEIAAKAGLHFTTENSPTPNKNQIETMVAGVALLDYDGDGYLDIYLVNGAAIPSLKKESPKYWNRLYHNNHDGTFTDVTEKAGLAGAGYGMGVAVGDYDNDGRPDIFVANVTGNQLFHNNGDGTFTDVTEKAGLSGAKLNGKKMWSVGAGWFDYNNDGLLDLFVVNYCQWEVNKDPYCAVKNGVRAYCHPKQYPPLHNTLYRNNGDGTFTDVSQQMGIVEHETFPTLINQGDGSFVDQSATNGLRSTADMSGWGNGIFDFDNDGWKDLFVARSNVMDNISLLNPSRTYEEPNTVFRNLGSGKFEDVSASAGPDFQLKDAHRGVAFGDLDNDGRIDAVVSVLGGPVEFFHNVSPTTNHWILLKLVGSKSNRMGIGAQIHIITPDNKSQWNEVTTATGYASSSDSRVHFGLGSNARIGEIEIRWPSGIRQTLREVAADQILTVEEPRTDAK